MPNYPCPPVGFQFTEENIHKAKAFYALWLLQVGLANYEVLTNTAIPYDGGFLSNSLGNLSGGVSGGVHKTDVTNDSRTLLMNLENLDWDQELLDIFGV